MPEEIVNIRPRAREASITGFKILPRDMGQGACTENCPGCVDGCGSCTDCQTKGCTCCQGEVLRLEMSFASEEPVERMDWDRWEIYKEILDCGSEKSARFDRINSGAPLLFNHDFDGHIGTIEKAWIDGNARKGYAVVRFGDNDLACQKVKDVKSGILKKVSFMYAVHAMQPDGEMKKGETPTYRSFDWEPYEISMVTVPADYTVGIDDTRRHGGPVACRVAGFDSIHQAARSAATKEGIMPDTTPAAFTAEEKKTLEERCAKLEKQIADGAADKNQLARFLKFTGIARNLNCLDIGIQAATEDWSDAKFGEEVAKRTKTSQTPENHLDLTPGDQRRYSVLALIRSLQSGDRSQAAYEWECSDQIGKRWNKEPDKAKVTRAAFLPHDIQSRVLPMQKRDLGVGTLTGGGYTVQAQYMSLIELLRHNSAILPFCTMLTGLVGDLKIARQTGAGTGYWLGEGGDPTESAQTFGLITMNRKKLGAFTDITEELLTQSSLDVEQFVISDLSRVLALKMDLAVISGAGAAGEPLGILNTSGIGSVTTSGGLTHAESVEFITDVINSDYQLRNGRYITNGTIMGTCMTTLRDSAAGAGYIWEGGVDSGRINGLPATYSTNVAASTMLFGDFSQVLVGKWGDLQIGVDLAANFLSGGVRVRLLDGMDVALRHVGAVSVATDI